MINEIVTNSIKHGFNGSSNGTISININQISESNYIMEIGDNGLGNGDKWDIQSDSTLGLNLIDVLTVQLDGSIEVDTSKKGTNYIINFQEIN